MKTIENFKSEVLLRIINAFKEEDGTSSILSSQLHLYGISDEALKMHTKQLIKSKDIEDISSNGFVPRFKPLTLLSCPDFLINPDLTLNNKAFILMFYNILPSYNKVPARELKRIINENDIEYGIESIYNITRRLKEFNLEGLFGILKDTKDITLEISHPKYTLLKTPKGYQINSKLVRGENTEERVIYKDTDKLCAKCGETDPDKFDRYRNFMCSKCAREEEEERKWKNVGAWLLSKCEKNANSRKYISANKDCVKSEINITEEYLNELYEIQGRKCYYSGVPFSKDYRPSVDRIDSSKGYMKGNVVICEDKINIMKSNLSIEEFKERIINIYNNLNNIDLV